MNDNRVILIKGGNNKWYEQAIFIVRKDAAAQIPVDFVAEAEKIINGYMHRKAKPAPARTRQQTAVKNTPLDYVLNTLIVVCCIALAAILTYAVFS